MLLLIASGPRTLRGLLLRCWVSAPVIGLFHAQGFGRLDAGYPQRRQKTGGECDDGKDDGNRNQGHRIVLAYSIEFAAESLGGEDRKTEPSGKAAEGAQA